MLASITPLGERGRQATWGITVSAFLLGSTAAGMALGSGSGSGRVGHGVTPSFTTSHMCTKMSAPMAPGISSMCRA